MKLDVFRKMKSIFLKLHRAKVLILDMPSALGFAKWPN